MEELEFAVNDSLRDINADFVFALNASDKKSLILGWIYRLESIEQRLRNKQYKDVPVDLEKLSEDINIFVGYNLDNKVKEKLFDVSTLCIYLSRSVIPELIKLREEN